MSILKIQLVSFFAAAIIFSAILTIQNNELKSHIKTIEAISEYASEVNDRVIALEKEVERLRGE